MTIMTTAAVGSLKHEAINAIFVMLTRPAVRHVGVAALIAGALAFVFGKSEPSRLSAGIVFAIGLGIMEINLVTWLFR